MDRRRFLKYVGTTLASSALTGCQEAKLQKFNFLTDSKWFRLASELKGHLVLPTDLNYISAAQTYNSRFDSIKPQAIVRCANVDDVIKTLAFVRNNKIAVTTRCGGHSFAGYSTTTGLVLDVGLMNVIEINNNGTAKVGAGARLLDVYSKLIAQGVSIPSGSCPTVGISGVTLGGGIGIFDRQYGLTCDNLIALEIITADGQLIQCDATHHSDLFWALRGGGGGNFGVVVSFIFKTHPIQTLTYFSASFRFEDAAKVLIAWQQLAESWPGNLWGQLFFNMAVSSIPKLTFNGYCLGEPSAIEPYWSAFLSATQSTPTAIKVVPQSYHQALLAEYENSPEYYTARWPTVASSDFFNVALPIEGINVMLQKIHAQKSFSGCVILDLMGGAISHIAPDQTAFIHRNALFSAFYAVTVSPDIIPTWQNEMRNLMKPWSNGAYLSYTDPLIEDWATAYYGENYARLTQIKAKYDPTQVFNFPQGIKPS
ncbi:MAG: FAD-binding oxidoreductase [Acidobacteria bacterium]|nr:FAD-binding oxidoreductase [Acidobacteriota bacterium]